MKGYLIIEKKYGSYHISGSLSRENSLGNNLFTIYDGKSRNEPVENWVVGSSSSYRSLDEMKLSSSLITQALLLVRLINGGQAIEPSIIEVNV